MRDRVTGYSLLATGIVIMLFAVIQVYLVFTNKISPPSIFQASALSVDLAKLLSNSQPQLPNQKPQAGQFEFLSAKNVNQTLNMSTDFFLMSFVIGFGFKISSLGVMLLRPVTVKMLEEKSQVKPQTTEQPTPQKR